MCPIGPISRHVPSGNVMKKIFTVFLRKVRPWPVPFGSGRGPKLLNRRPNRTETIVHGNGCLTNWLPSLSQ